jgi:rubrerythrin
MGTTGHLRGKPLVLDRVTEEVMAAVSTPSGTIEIFDPEKFAGADEVRFLQWAIDKEILANQGYLDFAKSAQTAEAKEMFLSLAKEEEMHARILQAEVDAIGQSGFSFDMQEFTMEQ